MPVRPAGHMSAGTYGRSQTFRNKGGGVGVGKGAKNGSSGAKLLTGAQATTPCMSVYETSSFQLQNMLVSLGWYRGKLGNGEHLSLEACKYKEYNIYA